MKRPKWFYSAIAAFVLAISMVSADSFGEVDGSGFTDEEASILQQVILEIKRSYVMPIDDKALLNAAINGMVSSLDPHSQFFEKQQISALKQQLQGGFGGVGLQVTVKNGVLTVYAPMDNTPASKAGIQAGDTITYINDESTQGLTVSDAVGRMHGKLGTTVKLTFLHGGTGQPRTANLTREFIAVSKVGVRIPDPGYAYIRIPTFDERIVPDLAAQLRNLARSTSDLKGLVLDLRFNGGGILQEAVGVASAFLPRGAVVVSVKGRTPGKERIYRNKFEDYRMDSYSTDPLSDLPAIFKSIPMVVLTNSQSVSVTEVVAGALQATHRAITMGSTTFGKGTIQVTGNIGNGYALMLTTAFYFTPGGCSIQNRGVVPDIEIDQDPNDDAAKKHVVREADLPRRLETPRSGGGLCRGEKDTSIVDKNDVRRAREPRMFTRIESPAELGSQDDIVLRQALQWLKSKSVLRDHKPPTDQHQQATG